MMRTDDVYPVTHGNASLTSSNEAVGGGKGGCLVVWRMGVVKCGNCQNFY